MALRADDVDLGRDRTLVEEFQAGNPAAFDDLYRRYFQRLFRFCLKRVGDVHEAEEVAQEAFTRAYLHLDGFGGDRRFYPWVTVIASRLCVDTHRRRARSLPSDQVDLGAVEGGQETILEDVDVVLVNQALDNVAPRHREVLDLRERHGLSYQSIAEHYGVSLGTVEALLWRARKALRREFLALTDGEAPVGGPATGVGLSRLAAWRYRLATWRYRAGSWLNQRSQPFIAGAAVVVTAAAMGMAPNTGGTAMAAQGGTLATGNASVSTSGATATEQAPFAVLGHSPGGPTRTVAGAAAPVISARDAALSQVRRAQVSVTVGNGGVGVNPQNVVPDVTRFAKRTATSVLAGSAATSKEAR